MSTWEQGEAAAFAKARLDEDTVKARATSPSGGRLSWAADVIAETDCGDCGRGRAVAYGVVSVGDVAGVAEALGLERGTGGAVAEHIARYDPARALREVEAGRRILERHRHCVPWGNGPCEHAGITGDEPCPDMRDLVVRWAGHPDYKGER